MLNDNEYYLNNKFTLFYIKFALVSFERKKAELRN